MASSDSRNGPKGKRQFGTASNVLGSTIRKKSHATSGPLRGLDVHYPRLNGINLFRPRMGADV